MRKRNRILGLVRVSYELDIRCEPFRDEYDTVSPPWM